MLGENFEDFVSRNKKERTEEALDYLKQLRKFSDQDIYENQDEYLDILTAFLEIVNKKDEVNKISLEDIGTTEKEIKYFEEKASMELVA